MKKKKYLLILLALLLSGVLVIASRRTRISSLESTKVELNNSFAQPNLPEPADPDKPVELLFLGDTMVARTVGESIVNGGDPLAYVKNDFGKYDFVVANLETNISELGVGTQAPGKYYTFNAPTQTIDYLYNSGIHAANLANNHSMDYGAKGLENEISLLEYGKIQSFGAGVNNNDAFRPLILERNGCKVALIGLNDIETYYTASGENSTGSAYLNETLAKNAIDIARTQADIVIIEVHWGAEYQLNYSASQVEWGHFFIDSGADLVVGMHPHVIQGSEIYRGKSIFYSLGNFLFDEMPTVPFAADGQVLSVKIVDKKIESFGLINIRLDQDGFPHFD